jgi:signal transduction histidine kinase
MASIVGVAGLALLLFAVPLAAAVANVYRDEAVTLLQRDAIRVAAVVPDDISITRDTVRLPADLAGGVTVGIYRTDGLRLSQHGPARSPVAASAADGRLHEAVESGQLAVAAPLPSDVSVSATVRVAMPYDRVLDRMLRGWLVMAGLAVLVVGLAALLARRQATRIAQPLEVLTDTARALGDGDFTVRFARSGIREADAAGAALEATASRLGDLVARERAFSSNVSHQLRTQLTALLLGVDSALSRADADLAGALRLAQRRGEQLQQTIEDLLSLARDTYRRGERLDLGELLGGVEDRWRSAFAAGGRRLILATEPNLPDTEVRAAAVRQILDVLVENALVHGAGETRVDVRDVGTGIAVEVSDEGPGLPGDPDAVFAQRDAASPAHGIGLALARSLAEAEGGRLVVRRPRPGPVFSLLLPPAVPSPRA